MQSIIREFIGEKSKGYDLWMKIRADPCGQLSGGEFGVGLMGKVSLAGIWVGLRWI